MKLLVSSACSLTVNVKLMLQLQHIDFDISDAVVPVLFTQSHMIFERIPQLQPFAVHIILVESSIVVRTNFPENPFSSKVEITR